MKVCVCILLLVCAVHARAESSVNQFLRQAVLETEVNSVAISNARVGGLNRWLNEVQLRTTDDPDKQGYALRFSPKMPNQIAAENAVLALRRQQQELVDQADLNDRLKSRYQQWLDLIEQQNRVEFIEKARDVANTEAQYQRSLAQTADFRPAALLEAELSQAQYSEQERLQRPRVLATQAALGIKPQAGALISIEEMLRVVAATPATEAGMDQRLEALALDLSKQRGRVDRARQGWAFDLLQVEVTTDEKTKSDSVGFLVGVRVPLGGASFNTAQRDYDVIAATADLKRRSLVAQRDAANLREQLDWRKAEAEIANNTLAAIDARVQRAQQSGELAIVLATQREQLKARERAAEVRQRALHDYLEFLHLNGRLAQQPLRNWLMPGLEPL